MHKTLFFVIAFIFWILLFFTTQSSSNKSSEEYSGPTFSLYSGSQKVAVSRDEGWQPVEYMVDRNEEEKQKFPELKQVSRLSVTFPLLELSKGNIPAILVRSVLSSKQISNLLRDLEKLPRLGSSDLKMALKISKSEKDFARVMRSASITEKEILKQHFQYRSIIRSIQRVIASLAAKEKKTLITLQRHRRYEIASTGFRVQRGGTGFPTHFDSLQASSWESKRKCIEKKKQHFSFVERLPHFTFENLLSTVAMLSSGNGNNSTDNAVRLYKCNYKSLVGVCRIKGRSHAIGANLSGFSKWAKERKIPTHDVELKGGDMYIFNANFVHEIIESKNKGKRMTMASFLSYDENKSDILPWI